MRSSMISVTTFSSSSSVSSNQYLGSGVVGGVNKRNPNGFLRISSGNFFLKSQLRSSRLVVTCCSTTEAAGKPISTSKSMYQGGAKVEMGGTNGFFLRENGAETSNNKFTLGVGSPKLPTYFPLQKLSLTDQVVFLMAFIACTTSLAFVSLVAAAVPTLYMLPFYLFSK